MDLLLCIRNSSYPYNEFVIINKQYYNSDFAIFSSIRLQFMLINKSIILLLDSKLNKFNQTINMSNSIADF